MMQDNYRPTFSIDVSINFGSQIIIFIVSSISSIIIARALGPSGKGIYSLAIAIPSLAVALTNMGINFSNIYFIGKKRFPIGLIGIIE